MAFTEKLISVQFSLASGEFEGGGNTATVNGLRVAAQIESTYGASNSSMTLAIYGLPLPIMQQLATVGADWSRVYQNGISVLAGDADGMSLVFTGVIFLAYVEAAAQPDVCLRVVARPGAFQAVTPAAPISINGSIPAATLMQRLAGAMGLKFENAGVQAQLSNPYYTGSAWDMAYDIAQDANFDIVVERDTLAIIPRSGAREGPAVDIGPDNGMVGYPAFAENSIIVKAEFSPTVRVGALIDVTSEITPACGQWKVINIALDLESIAPDGGWFMTIQAILP